MKSNGPDSDPAPPTQNDRAELARRLLALPVDELRQAANYIVGYAVLTAHDAAVVDALLQGHEARCGLLTTAPPGHGRTVPPTPWMTVQQAAEHARMSPEDLGDACRSGELRATQRRPKGRWRIHVDNLDAWLLGEPQGHEAPRLARGRNS